MTGSPQESVPPPAASEPVHLHRIGRERLDLAADAGELFAIVDGCMGPAVLRLVEELGPECAACLYLGVAAENYRDKAPYLVRVDRALAAALPKQMGDAAWGCYLTSTESFDAVRQHVRGLLTVSSPEGESWLFRFWDPRLLPTFLRASTPEELNAFFGPVGAFALISTAGVAFAAYRDPAIVDVAPRRSVGGRFAISQAHVAAFRRASVGDALVETFSGGSQRARRDPANDDVLLEAADGGVTRMHLGENGLVGGVTSPLGRRWSIGSREDGKLARFVTPSGSTLSIGYDAQGRVAQVARDGQERFRADHDEVGRLRRVDFPDGTSAHNVYAFEGASAVADEAGDYLSARRDRLGRVERFAYDGDSLTAIEDGAGNVTRFDYATSRRPDSAWFADGAREEYQYNPDGHLARLVRRDGKGLDVTCDRRGRPTRIATDDGALATFEYDEAGHLVAARNAEVALAWRYDEAGRLIEERQGDIVVRHHHDEGGPIGITYPTGETVRWRRDLDQRIAELTDWSGGHYALEYADADAGWRMTGPDGVATTTWQNPQGFSAAVRAEAAGTVLWDATYAHDGEDRLRERHDSRLGPVAYDYDAESQLVHEARPAREERFAFDGAGNRTACAAGSATFDACNRLLSQGGTSFRYDARGRMVERAGPGGVWRFRHDGFDRLVAAEDGGGRRLEFGYDPLGRRLWKRAVGDGRETLTRFVWAGEQLIREEVERVGGAAHWGDGDGSGATTRDFLYWPLSWTPLLLREGGTIHRYHADPNGTPVRVTAPGGRVVWEADGDGWGLARVRMAEVAQPLRLPGQYADDEFGLGLHYNRHRYYDPAIGRYISPDPLGVAAGSNLYQYAGNDPVNGADPLGLVWWKTALVVAAGVAAVAAVVVAAPLVLPALGIAAGTFAFGAVTTLAAGTLAGAAGMMVNEALNEKTFCASCIFKAGLKGGAIGFVAALPLALLPATAGVAAFMGAGAVGNVLGYTGDCLANGHPWTMQGAALAAATGALTAGLARYLGPALLARRVAAVPPSAPEPIPAAPSAGASFGTAASNNYRATFFAAHPELEGQVIVHHAVEQQVFTRYPGVVSEEEMHSLENLRGIPREVNSDLHLSQIRREWNQFYRQNANPTQQQLLDKATEIDNRYGSQFNPPR